MAGITESSDGIVGKLLGGLIRGWNGSAQSTYGYAAGSLTLLATFDAIPAVFKTVRRGDLMGGSETVRIKREGSRSYARTAVSPIRV